MTYNLLIAKNKTHTKHTGEKIMMVKMFGLRYWFFFENNSARVITTLPPGMVG
jgi:hypothetical protein